MDSATDVGHLHLGFTERYGSLSHILGQVEPLKLFGQGIFLLLTQGFLEEFKENMKCSQLNKNLPLLVAFPHNYSCTIGRSFSDTWRLMHTLTKFREYQFSSAINFALNTICLQIYTSEIKCSPVF